MLEKVIQNRVLRSRTISSHEVWSVEDTSALKTGNIQLSVVEDRSPEIALNNIINEFPQLNQQDNPTVLSVVTVPAGLLAQS